MTNWNLRPAAPQDATPLVACIDAAYAGYRTRGVALPDVSGGISDDIDENIVFVAAKEADILGGIILYVQTDYLQLANIAVDPEHGGKGIGKALQADEVARSLTLTRLTLATHVEIPENVNLYRHLGWAETGRDDTKVLMEKRL